MHPKMRQQIGNQQATSSARKQPGPQRPQTRAAMTTEYQERFLSPRCYTAVGVNTRQRDPYHPLKGTSADMSTFGSYYVTYKWVKNPPMAQQPPVPPQGPRRCSTAPHNHSRPPPNRTAPEAADYTTVYKNDFRAWAAKKRKPIKQQDCLKVNQGLSVTDESHGKNRTDKVDYNPKVPEPQPLESVTSYRFDFVSHPLQPRQRRDEPVYQPGKGLSLEPEASFRPKVTWDTHGEHCDEAGEILEHIKTWSIETKFHGRCQAKEDDSAFLSTTHGDYTAHRYQRVKPVLPQVHNGEKRSKGFQGTTTMKEDYKAWDHKEERGWPKQPPASARPPKPAENFNATSEPVGLHSKRNKTTACNCSCDAAESPQRLAESPQRIAESGAFSGFECIIKGTRGGTGPPL